MTDDPAQERPWVIRTVFADDSAWNTICAAIAAPVLDFDEEFFAYVRFVNDPVYKDAGTEQIRARLPATYNYYFLFVVDRTTTSHPESPILVIDLHNDPHPDFRAIPTTIQSIENNLSIANMDFEEFAGSVDDDGIFRGFPND